MRYTILVALAFLTTAAAAGAQRGSDGERVRTFPLQYLQPAEAAHLLSPYLPQGTVYEAGVRIAAITVRADAAAMLRVQNLLDEYDRPPVVVVLHFQLIAADSGAAGSADPAIADVAGTLRELFRFPGYRLLTQTAATVAVNEPFAQKVSAGGTHLDLKGAVSTVALQPREGAPPSARVNVELTRFTGIYQGLPRSEAVLRTTLSIPLGQTVVLGSAAVNGKHQALILTVRPEVKR